MKIKLKNFLLDTLIIKNNIKSDKFQGNKLLSVTYDQEPIQFQTPCINIYKIESTFDKKFIHLQFLDNNACRFFIQKIKELEKYLCIQSHAESIQSLIDTDGLIRLKMTKNTKLFEQIYQIPISTLSTECKVICLVQLSNVWITTDNTAHYNLEVLEILKT
jgi:hypothetical protein